MVLYSLLDEALAGVGFAVVFIVVEALWVVQVLQVNLSRLIILIVCKHRQHIRPLRLIASLILISVEAYHQHEMIANFLLVKPLDLLDALPLKLEYLQWLFEVEVLLDLQVEQDLVILALLAELFAIFALYDFADAVLVFLDPLKLEVDAVDDAAALALSQVVSFEDGDYLVI